MKRREFLTAALSGVALAGLAGAASLKATPRCRAVLFDAFPIFDPRPVFALAEELFPGHGAALSSLWKTRQFEYMWLSTLMGRYIDFPTATRDALVFATRASGLELSNENRDRLVGAYFALKAWPDVIPALDQLRSAGLRLGFLSNFSQAMLAANLKSAGLASYFDEILSTDQVRAFKPDLRAYQMGVTTFSLKAEQIAFAAFAGWDAAGAKNFGYPTFWVNRADAPVEVLNPLPDATGALRDLVAWVTGSS